MARVLVSVLSVALSAGCAQLAGIEATNGNERGGNSVALTRTSIGAQVTTAPLDLVGLDATYLVVNPDNAAGFDRVRAGDAGQGRWTVDIANPAPVELTVPEVPSLPLLVASDNRALALSFDVLEHPGRAPAPVPAMLNLSVTLDAMTTETQKFDIVTVGSWSSRPFAATELPPAMALQLGPVVYDFATSRSESGRAALDRLTTQDAYLVLRHEAGQLTGLAEAAPFDQTGDDTVAATMVPVAADQELDVLFDPAALSPRYAKVTPAVSDLQMAWSLTAAPGFAQGRANGPVLYSGELTPLDIGVNVAYGNPFAARTWKTLFTLSTSETRIYTPPGTTTPVTLTAGMTQLVEPSPRLTLTLPAALPEALKLDGKPLDADGVAIARPSGLVEVTFVADAPEGSLYSLQVFELVLDPIGTALVPRLTLTAMNNEPTFQLPPDIFLGGRLYTLRATCQVGGYPNLATGDFVTRSLPLAQSFVDSAVISVTP